MLLTLLFAKLTVLRILSEQNSGILMMVGLYESIDRHHKSWLYESIVITNHLDRHEDEASRGSRVPDSTTARLSSHVLQWITAQHPGC